MNPLFFFLVAFALGTANPIGPKTTDLIKTSIHNNILWLVRGIRKGSFLGPDFARAVVALYLAKPGYFSAGHEIGRELKYNIAKNLRPLILRWNDEPSFIPSVELAWYVQALVVSCMDPRNFFGYDLLDVLWRIALRDCRLKGVCNFPSFVLLVLCKAGATSPYDLERIASYYLYLSDEEAFTTMSIACLESQGIWNISDIDTYSNPIRSSGYRYHPSKWTVEKLQELMNPDDGYTASLSAIAAAMQTLMSNHLLQVSYLPWAVDFLLNSQGKDGSWGQSTLNSFFILPVLSNKCFLDISREHCPAESGNDEDMFLENEKLEEPKDYRRVVIYIRNDSYTLRYSIIHRTFGKISTLHDELMHHSNKAIYHNRTDDKPYLTSLLDKENNPETGYTWFTFEQTKYPKETLTLLTQSHADIKLRRDRSYVLWYSQSSKQEAYGRPNMKRQQAKEITYLLLS